MKRLGPAASVEDVEPFLSDLVHDLRNLLDGVAMSLVQDTTPSPARTLQEVTFRNVYDVLRKTEDFLDRTRPPRRAQGNAEMASVVKNALEDLRVFLRDRDVSVMGLNGLWVAADARALRRILENVLHVVWKLTRQGDALCLSVHRRKGEIDLIIDVPELAAPAEPEELFSEDFRNGLDLWVSRETARACGGELSCEAHENGFRLVLKLPEGDARA